MPAAQLDRRLLLEQTYNLRDVGGYRTADDRRTRWRTLLRSDNLHRLTPAAQATLLATGLRTVVDLRREQELAAAPDVFAASPAVSYLHRPMIEDRLGGGGDPVSLEDLYVRLLDFHHARIAHIIGEMARPGRFPALVHCTAGKDRTGLIVALLLDIAGVPHQTIVEDYDLSGGYLAAIMDELREQGSKSGVDVQALTFLLEVRAEAMAGALAHLQRQYGGAAAYLRMAGLGHEDVTFLRDTLVE